MLVTSDQVENGKPAPDPYLLAAERLGVDPAACVVFEDAPAGIASGRAAGMTGVGGHDDARAGRARRGAAGGAGRACGAQRGVRAARVPVGGRRTAPNGNSRR